MRFLIILSLIFLFIINSSSAEQSDRNYIIAEKIFDRMPDDQQFVLQYGLLTGGYLLSVPSETFNSKLFQATALYQKSNDLPESGFLDEQTVSSLIEDVKHVTEKWAPKQLKLINYPYTIWLPTYNNMFSIKQTENGGYSIAHKSGSFNVSFYVLNKNISDVVNTIHDHIKIFDKHTLRKNDKDLFIDFSSNDHLTAYIEAIPIKDKTLVFHSTWVNIGDTQEYFNMTMMMSVSAIMNFVHYNKDMFNFRPPMINNIGHDKNNDAAIEKSSPTEQRALISGTGFFINDGFILTNNHVIENCSNEIIVENSFGTGYGNIIGHNSETDLAVLKTNLKTNRIAKFRNSPVVLGEDIAEFGYPLHGMIADSGNFTIGNVSGLRGYENDAKMFQVTNPTQIGNSGSPTFDFTGNVVGIVTLSVNSMKIANQTSGFIPQNVNFATKISTVKKFLDDNGIKYYIGEETDRQIDKRQLAKIGQESSVKIHCFKK